MSPLASTVRRSALDRLLPVFVLLALAAGCGVSEPLIQERLDQSSGVTITYADAPLIFYRDQSSRAAYARDFIDLAPLRVNRMGEERYYLWLAAWSTMQDESLAEKLDGLETIVIFADGEPMRIELTAWTPGDLGISQPVYTKPLANAGEAYYEVTADQLRLMAHARDLRLQTAGSGTRHFEPWRTQEGGLDGMRAFLTHVGY